MKSRKPSRLLIPVLMSLSCVPDGTPHGPDTLAGAWAARFELDSAWSLPGTTNSTVAAGSLTLLPAISSGETDSLTVHNGTFAIEFAGLGFDLQDNEALAWDGAGDSVTVVLRPDVDHGHVFVRALWFGDTLRGEWTLVGDPMGARGHVTFSRSENQ